MAPGRRGGTPRGGGIRPCVLPVSQLACTSRCGGGLLKKFPCPRSTFCNDVTSAPTNQNDLVDKNLRSFWECYTKSAFLNSKRCTSCFLCYRLSTRYAERLRSEARGTYSSSFNISSIYTISLNQLLNTRCEICFKTG